MFEGNLFQEDVVVAASSFLKSIKAYNLGNKMDFKFYKHASA